MEIFGYEFANEALLKEALTTPSFKMQHPDAQDNQRLEFLGDAVLGLMGAERVYGIFTADHEGSLTVRRAHMVSSAALCEAADRLGLAERLVWNRRQPLPPKQAKVYADAVEAILGAVYLDGGLDAARRVFAALGLSDNAKLPEWAANPKGELQVRAQAMNPPRRPRYELLETAGKAHEPVFKVRASVEGMGEAIAVARTHKEAEAKAATELLTGASSGATGCA